jgi:hypothetical protein
MPRKCEFASTMITDSPGRTISRGSLILPLSSTLVTAIFTPNARIFPNNYISPTLVNLPHRARDGFEPVSVQHLEGRYCFRHHACSALEFPAKRQVTPRTGAIRLGWAQLGSSS